MVKISVVIPTYNRKELLKNCLEALFDQSYSQENFEIIVIDDGSNESAKCKVQSAKLGSNKFNLVFFEQKHQGPGAARNLGVKKAVGDIIAFTDDDCLPTKDWLEQIDKTFRETPDALGVEGKTVTDKRKADLFTYQVTNEGGGQYWTCNIAYKKSAFTDAGGFDEQFDYAHCEDIDLARRILKRGEIVFASAIIVTHPARKVGLFSGFKKISYLEDEFRLYQKHKDYFSQFFPVKNEFIVFCLMTFGNHIAYRLKLIKDSLGTFSQNPFIWFKYFLKNFLEIIWVFLIFPKALIKVKTCHQ